MYGYVALRSNGTLIVRSAPRRVTLNGFPSIISAAEQYRMNNKIIRKTFRRPYEKPETVGHFNGFDLKISDRVPAPSDKIQFVRARTMKILRYRRYNNVLSSRAAHGPNAYPCVGTRGGHSQNSFTFFVSLDERVWCFAVETLYRYVR